MEPRYSNPFVKEAILRVDLSPAIDVNDEIVEGPFAAANSARFPNVEPRVQAGQEFQFGPEGMSTKEVEKREWRLLGGDRKRRLVLAEGALIASCKEYSGWSELRQDFVTALDSLVGIFPDMQITRLGVRYVNFVSLQEANPFVWREWIDSRLTGPLEFPDDPRRITRSMHILQLEYPDGFQLKYQFGLPNPDFPAPVKQKHFVMDLDASASRILTVADVKKLLDPMHEAIKELFESSITDGLRGKMGVVALGSE